MALGVAGHPKGWSTTYGMTMNTNGFLCKNKKNYKVALHPGIQHQHHCLYNQTPPMDSTSAPLPSEPNSSHGFNINTIAFTTKLQPWIQHQHHCLQNQIPPMDSTSTPLPLQPNQGCNIVLRSWLIREMAIDATQKPVVGLRHHYQ